VIDPSVRAVLRSRYTIRRFFLLFGAILVVALAGLWVLASNHSAPSPIGAVGTEFLQHLAADDALLIATYSFYIFVTPPGLRDALVLPLRSGEIADGIIDLPVGASDYWFWGRSGTYFRSVVLPKLDESARKERRHIRVQIVIPDPDGPGNASRYARMKRTLGEEADEHTLPAKSSRRSPLLRPPPPEILTSMCPLAYRPPCRYSAMTFRVRAHCSRVTRSTFPRSW
jgi:hypothetical protein